MKKPVNVSAGSAGNASSGSNVARSVDGRSKVNKAKTGLSFKALKLSKVKELLAAKREKDVLQRTSHVASTSTQSRSAPAIVARCVGNRGTSTSASSVGNSPVEGGLSALQQKMQQKLKGARFRWINEALYTTTGDKAFEMVQNDPSIFEEYHSGFSAQVEKWPVNPVDIFIKCLRGKPRLVVADLGCGEARLAATVGKQHTVHSFDLVAHNELITPCNIAKVPLSSGTVDVAIFCLALMGTDFIAFIREANRILRVGGELKIAEVVSRVSNVDAFVKALEEQGFKLAHTDTSNKMFIMLDFVKAKQSPARASSKPGLLKPCIYKRR